MAHCFKIQCLISQNEDYSGLNYSLRWRVWLLPLWLGHFMTTQQSESCKSGLISLQSSLNYLSLALCRPMIQMCYKTIAMNPIGIYYSQTIFFVHCSLLTSYLLNNIQGYISNMAASIHTRPLIYKIIKVKENVKCTFFIAVATFQELGSYLRLWGAVLEMRLVTYMHCSAKCYQRAPHTQGDTWEEERSPDMMVVRQAWELMHPWFTEGPWKKFRKELSQEKRAYEETLGPNKLIVLGYFFLIHEYLFYRCQ